MLPGNGASGLGEIDDFRIRAGARRRRARCRPRAAASPLPPRRRSCRRSSRSISTRTVSGTGNGATPPGSNPVAASDLARASRRARSPRPSRRRASPRRRGGRPARARSRPAVADEDERLDDLRRLAADRVAPRLRRSSSLAGTPRSAPSTPCARRTAATRSTGSGQALHASKRNRRADGRCNVVIRESKLEGGERGEREGQAGPDGGALP